MQHSERARGPQRTGGSILRTAKGTKRGHNSWDGEVTNLPSSCSSGSKCLPAELLRKLAIESMGSILCPIRELDSCCYCINKKSILTGYTSHDFPVPHRQDRCLTSA